MTARAPSARVRVRRLPKRGAYDPATIAAVLDAGLVAHLGFVVDGQPYVVPTLHARVGDTVYVHGSSAGRALRALAAGAPACLTVTLLDGMVLARSAFHHSVNYRSVVVLGRAVAVTDPREKLAALEAFMERLTPGRWAEVRPPDARELAATAVLRFDLAEASAKLRTGGPVDDAEDLASGAWAGVVPLALRAGEPQAAADLDPAVPPSPATRAFVERHAGRSDRVDLVVHPATPDRWEDVVAILGGSDDRGCWCQSWRGRVAGDPSEPGASNRARLEAQVRAGAFAPGVIAYLDGEPVGWCGLGPRAAMSRLARSRTIPAVDGPPPWSIGCFVVRAGFRRRGVARALLDGAVAHARASGAAALEAYPIDPAGARVSSAFGFVGFTSMFEAAGFRRVLLTDGHSAGLRRWLVRLELA